MAFVCCFALAGIFASSQTVYAATIPTSVSDNTYTLNGETNTTGYQFTNTSGSNTLTVTGENTITVTDVLSHANDSHGSATGIYSMRDLTIDGTGTLTINVNIPNDLACNYGKFGIKAESLVIKGSVTVNINVSGGSNGESIGIHTDKNFTIQESATLNVTASSPTDAYGIVAYYGGINIDGTGTKTVTISQVGSTGFAHGICNFAHTQDGTDPLENMGDITISGNGKLTVTMPNDKGQAITSYYNTINLTNSKNADGTILIQNANVELNGGTYGILGTSKKRTVDDADIIVQNSTLNIATPYGIQSYFNGILIENSTVNVTGSSHAIDLNGAASDARNQSAYGLDVKGLSVVSLTSTDGTTLYCGTSGYNHIHNIDLSEGGSFTVTGSNEFAAQGYFEIGENSHITSGTIWNNKTVDADSTTGIFKVEYRSVIEVDVPSAISGLVYNKTEQTGVNEGEGYTLTGHKQTNAGSYTATATLQDGYKWSDNTTEPKQISWSIAKKQVEIPTANDLTYNGSFQDGIPESDDYTRDNYSKKNASAYTATITLNSTTNYEWKDGHTEASRTIGWTIKKAEVTPPTPRTDLVYTGESLTAFDIDYTLYDLVSGNSNTAINAGPKTTTLKLNDTNNYVWSTINNSDNITISWNIARKKIGLPTAIPNLVYNGTSQVGITVVEGCIVKNNSNKATVAGTHTATVGVADNYQWNDGTIEDKTVQFTIARKPIPKPIANTGLVYNGTQKTGVTYGAGYTLTDNTGRNAGTYTAKATPTSNYMWEDDSTGTIDIEWSIAKADKNAPTAPYAGNCSNSNNNNGQLLGVSNEMEWKLKSGTDWNSISGNAVDNLVPGTYEVRYKESQNYNASAVLEVVINEYNHVCSGFTKTERVEPTHFKEGKEAYWTCPSCDKHYSNENGTGIISNINTWGIIPKTAHELSDWKHDENNHWKECIIEGCTHKEQEQAHKGGTATCTEQATCEDCLEKYGELVSHNHAAEWSKDSSGHWHECECGDKKDYATHNYNKQVATDEYKATDATCIEKSTYYSSCECGAKGTTTFEYGAKAEHTYGTEYEKDATYHWKECDCGHEDYKYTHTYENTCDDTCNTCGYERTVSGHVYDNDDDATCNECGHTRKIVKVTNGTKVENADGTITITANAAPEGKQFKGWQNELGEIVSTDVAYTVNASVNLTAVYEDVTVTPVDPVDPVDPTDPVEPTPTDPTDPTEPTVEPTEKKGLSGGAIAGIAVGSVALIGIGGFAIFWFAIKKKSFADLIAAIKAIFKK